MHHSSSKILKLYKNKCLTESWSLDIGGKGYKLFELNGHIFVEDGFFLYREGGNNYSISMTIYGYNPKLSL